VFDIEIENCVECGGKLRIIACIEDLPLICTIRSTLFAHDYQYMLNFSYPRKPTFFMVLSRFDCILVDFKRNPGI